MEGKGRGKREEKGGEWGEERRLQPSLPKRDQAKRVQATRSAGQGAPEICPSLSPQLWNYTPIFMFIPVYFLVWIKEISLRSPGLQGKHFTDEPSP